MCYLLLVRNFLLWKRDEKHTKNLSPRADKKRKTPELTKRRSSNVLAQCPFIRFLRYSVGLVFLQLLDLEPNGASMFVGSSGVLYQPIAGMLADGEYFTMLHYKISANFKHTRRVHRVFNPASLWGPRFQGVEKYRGSFARC